MASPPRLHLDRSSCLPCPAPSALPQEHIEAGLVEYQHFTSFQHPSGKPQLYAYDQ